MVCPVGTIVVQPLPSSNLRLSSHSSLNRHERETLRLDAVRFVGRHEYGITVVPAADLNRNLVAHNDVFNLSVAITALQSGFSINFRTREYLELPL